MTINHKDRFHMLLSMNEPIESAELYMVQIDTQRHFSFGTWHSRQHLFLSIGSGGQFGWGEEVAALNSPDFDPQEWGSLLRQLKGVSIAEALIWLNREEGNLSYRLREMTEMALIDLAGKLIGKTAAELLGLVKKKAVPGLFCLLENDRSVLKEKAEQAKAQGFLSHVKLKLFGDEKLDESLISTVREVYSNQAYMVGDVNYGYKVASGQGGIEQLAATLTTLSSAGLSACEDPAEMDISQWEQLQLLVDPLDLIPDVLLRPAILAIETVTPNMGNVFNIHPGAMGSMLDSVLLAEKIQSFDGQVMIGDNSLIGPACTAWQQLAIGLGACWVEALEKEAEFPQFDELAQQRTTSLGQDGLVSLLEPRFGFGLQMDTALLRRCCNKYSRVF